ncbi:hypothetical protein AcV5_009490 [Taiwanofungus camphoratus]|nr:hypothetical protein AcV5_009490 [Antrodia cinnamomea]
MSSIISLNVEFGGGLELLFSNRRKHRIDLPARVPAAAASTASERGPEASAEGEQPQGRPADITYLILWLRDNLLTERAELFVENGTVYVTYLSSRFVLYIVQRMRYRRYCPAHELGQPNCPLAWGL